MPFPCFLKSNFGCTGEVLRNPLKRYLRRKLNSHDTHIEVKPRLRKKNKNIKGNEQKKKQIDMVLGAGNQQGIQSKTNERVIKLVRNSRKHQKGAIDNKKKGRSNWRKHVEKTCRPSGSTHRWVSGLLVGLLQQYAGMALKT